MNSGGNELLAIIPTRPSRIAGRVPWDIRPPESGTGTRGKMSTAEQHGRAVEDAVVRDSVARGHTRALHEGPNATWRGGLDQLLVHTGVLLAQS